jgi:Ca-activated chloride channel family protein
VAAAIALASLSVGWLDPQSAAREGNRLYDAGRYDEAADRYRDGLVDDPDSPRLHFNMGAARYKSGQYDDALAAFERAPGDDADPARAARQAYNLGNTKFRQGAALEQQQPQQALALWKEAVAAYRRGLGVDPGDTDAKFNHELVEKKVAALEKRIEQQQQQQQQQQGQDQQDEQQRQEQGDSPAQPPPEQQGREHGGAGEQQQDRQDAGGQEPPEDDAGRTGDRQDGERGEEQRPGESQQANGRPQPGSIIASASIPAKELAR